MKAYEVIDASSAALDHPSALMVFWRVALFASGTEGVCYASVDTLHKQTRLSVRTVQRSLQVLVQSGMLVALESPGRTTEYRVPPPPWHPRHGDTPDTVAPTPDTVAPTPDTVAPDPESIRSRSGTNPSPQPPPQGAGASQAEPLVEWVTERAMRELEGANDVPALLAMYDAGHGGLLDSWMAHCKPRRVHSGTMAGQLVRKWRDAPDGLRRRDVREGLLRAAQRWREHERAPSGQLLAPRSAPVVPGEAL